MSPFVVITAPGNSRTRRRKTSSTAPVENMDARILLPELPSLDRVPLPVSLPYRQWWASNDSRSSMPQDLLPSMMFFPKFMGNTVYPTQRDVYPSTIPPIFGDISGTEIEAALCDPLEVYAPIVYAGTEIQTSFGDPAPTQIAFNVGRLEHDEGDTGELTFGFEGGLPPNARFQERFFETREDAELEINPLSEADSPKQCSHSHQCCALATRTAYRTNQFPIP